MVNKLLYTALLLLALPFVYIGLGIIFLVSGTASLLESIWRIWR